MSVKKTVPGTNPGSQKSWPKMRATSHRPSPPQANLSGMMRGERPGTGSPLTPSEKRENQKYLEITTTQPERSHDWAYEQRQQRQPKPLPKKSRK